MPSIEDRILAYGELSDEERRALEAEIQGHPRWMTLLQDVKRLDDLAAGIYPSPDDAQHPPPRQEDLHEDLHEDAPGDPVLAWYVVARYLDTRPLDPELRDAFDEVEARIGNDPAVARRAARYRRRIERAVAAVHPVSHFAALAAENDAADASPQTDPDPALAAVPNASSDTPSSTSSAADDSGTFPNDENRSPDGLPGPLSAWARVPKALQFGLAAFAVAVMLYGSLLGLSTFTTSPVQELSAVEDSETAIEGYQSSPEPIDDVDAATPDELFLRALSLIREARTTTLGLFPQYDRGDLSRAHNLLDQVLSRDGTGDFLRREAFFFRAKTRLALGEVEAARSDFKTVAQLDSRRAREAVSILKQLQDAYPARPGDVQQ